MHYRHRLQWWFRVQGRREAGERICLRRQRQSDERFE